MGKRTFSTLAGILLLLGTVGVGTIPAAIINIDARNNHTLNPVIVFFEAGTYNLNPIGVADGGAYNSFSADDGNNSTWLWRYTMESDELGFIQVNHLPYSNTEMEAFATAVSTSFTLTSSADVSFYIYDGPGGYLWSNDNVKGISLSTVPLPGAVWLLGSGLIGIVGVRRKFEK